LREDKGMSRLEGFGQKTSKFSGTIKIRKVKGE
jgi:hypothetical protein